MSDLTLKLPLTYYQKTDTVALAQNLLGKFLLTRLGDESLTGGEIVETEAYVGTEDKACHAHLNRRTKRTEIMFAKGGKAYIYLCYGVHPLFNIVTHQEGEPHAILIRALRPEIGIDIMLKRRGLDKLNRRICGGPGALTKALAISTTENGVSLDGEKIWLEDRGMNYESTRIIASPRVGINYAEEHMHLPWRFRLKDSPWTSPAR
ncbi:MAG: DNA-3-methyladenine glycosylase [Candidatus Caenarcaniphilales bacterium]|nr:DNA-3-methyladenine glycosylase [Candidatus Caenarcaniphilales bacterium]